VARSFGFRSAPQRDDARLLAIRGEIDLVFVRIVTLRMIAIAERKLLGEHHLLEHDAEGAAIYLNIERILAGAASV
jgi:hypothetical protein